MRRLQKPGAVVCLFFAFAAAEVHAQGYTPPPPPLTTAPCVPTKKNPCTQPNATPKTPAATNNNPFPGEPATPGSAAVPVAAPSASDANPFPGEPPAPATPTPGTPTNGNPFPGEPDAPASSSSSTPSSSSSSNSSSDAGDGAESALKDEGSNGSTRFERKRLPKIGRAPEDREAEDLDVSKFYSEKGDYHAAYLRAKDAVETVPSDPEAHYLLADAARHVGKPEEARTEFDAYLKMEPDGDHSKAAHQALSGLAPK